MFKPILIGLNLDAPESWGIFFQDGATPVFEGLTELHNSIFFYLILIGLAVGWIIFSVVYNFNSNVSPISHRYYNHGTIIELVWTVTPAFILAAIAFPSFKILYLSDEVISPSITIKTVGHQWYWSYELSDFIDESGDPLEFDSYIVPDSDLEQGNLRLLEVDNRLIVPVDTHIRIVTAGADVIHDWAVPSLGIKIDSIPGRLNQSSILIQREGVYYGQCSELCGPYHGFIPIVVEALHVDKYLIWLDSQF